MKATAQSLPMRTGGVPPAAIACSLAIHLLIIGLAFVLSIKFAHEEETVIPIDMTIVPPWAQQTDDPDPDPNPPPKPEPPKPKPKPAPPKPKPEVPKPVREVEAVERVEKVEKPKPPEKKPDPPKPLNLREKAKLVTEPPKPLNLRDRATRVEAPPLPPGKGTAADKPLSPEEFRRKMMEGYRIGARNQLATSEAQRCVSLISEAVRREWDKESFNWHEGLRKLTVTLQFGPVGVVRGYRIVSGSGDAEVDRTAANALRRLHAIPGLSAVFLEENATFTFTMTPVSGN